MPDLLEPAPSGRPEPQAAAALIAPENAKEVRSFVEKANRDYLYWDDFKYLKTPEGVTPADAWRYLKSIRTIGLLPTRVRDVHGHHFAYTITTEVQRCLHVIDRDAGGAVLAAGRIPKHGEQRYLISRLMEEAIASSQIEGASTTRREAKEMLRTKREPRNHSERMILNNYNTIMALRKVTDEPISVELLMRMQAMLTTGTLEDPYGEGRLRRPGLDDDIVVHDAATHEVVHRPPAAAKLPKELQRLCDYANDDSGPFEHPALKAIVLHFWLAYLHPFVDGNGRTARALFYLYMLKSGYWLFEYLSVSQIIHRRRGKYSRAYLYSETDDCDMTYFVTFHLHAVEAALTELWHYLKEKAEEDKAISERMARDRTLNHRQRALLSRAIEDGNASFTFESHRASHGVTYPTAREDLLRLVERGYLERTRAGKAFVFIPSRKLRKLAKESSIISQL